MIRAARPEDIPALVPMVAWSWSRSGWDDLVPGDLGSIEHLMRTLIDHESGIVLVADEGSHLVGFVAAEFGPHLLNRSILAARELGWWAAKPGAGRALLRALEEEAARLDVRVVITCCLEASRPAAVGRLFRSAGYRPAEHVFIKGI